MHGVAIYYYVMSALTVVLAIMMMAKSSFAPKGIRIMATKLGVMRFPVGLLLIAAAALLVFGQNL